MIKWDLVDFATASYLRIRGLVPHRPYGHILLFSEISFSDREKDIIPTD